MYRIVVVFNNQFRLKLRSLSLFAMIMVVYVHAYTFDLGGYTGALTTHKSYNSLIQDFVSQGFARVATPLFFILSGFLMFSKYSLQGSVLYQKYSKRMVTLFVPFLLWSLYGILLYYALQLIPEIRPFFKHHVMQNMSGERFLETLFIDPIPYQLWFLRDLMVLVVLSPVIWLLVRYLKSAILLAMLVVWVLDIDFILFTSNSLFFLSLGCYLTLAPKLMQKLVTSYHFKLPLIIWLSLLIIKTVLNYIGYPHPFQLLFMHKLAILIGVYAVWLTINTLADKTTFINRKWLNTSISPFFIYAFHEPLLSILKKGMLYLLDYDEDSTALLVYILVPVLTIILCIFVAQILKQNIPWLFHLLTGNRDKKMKRISTEEMKPETLIISESV